MRRALASQTPTLATATLDELSTSRVPDPELHRSSVADALADRAPFVVVFATPKYCTSRTCGPVVDVVSAVRREHAGSGIRFIHVEIYKDNDPAKGVNQWVKEWKLPSEPWVFVVGAGRQGARPVRGHRLGARARRVGAQAPAPLVSGVFRLGKPTRWG